MLHVESSGERDAVLAAIERLATEVLPAGPRYQGLRRRRRAARQAGLPDGVTLVSAGADPLRAPGQQLLVAA
ncbi:MULTISPECIES: hypothetical protein [unclassified Pseudonocardia]|uniref:hypothetical protein n=1 Tax=unclassified Pseudonocardia TaxID=2619320 RepID=UPI00094AC6BA|nr:MULTISPECIES: hypothetical protein [unclassified Pseudonocardia]